ncbi:MAG: OmpA family protein [Gammaproteobacteria bacterium]|nr:OmpA family protein [Gammaproteobacteria bacterium]
MKTIRSMRTIGALALLGVALPLAAAPSAGPYFGASAGQARAEIDEDDIKDDLLESGFTTTDFDDNDRDFGYRLFAGWRFNPHVSIEGGYFDLGEVDFTATTDPAGSLDGRLEFSGWNLDLLGMWPVTERASLVARVGAHYGEAEVAYATTGSVNVLRSRFSNTELNHKVGVGFHYRLTDALGLRLEVERYRMDDSVGNTGDLDLLSAGLVYHFGRAALAPAPRAATPAPAPPAAPVEVAVPLPAATEQYCSLLDIQFEIARDEIQRAEREKLAVLATFLQRYPETTAVIEGHTDDVGSAERNMELSLNRAESVVDYLVREHRIDPSRLRATGLGETRPIASNRTEAGKVANRRIGAIIGCATDISGLEPLAARMTFAMQIEFDRNSADIKPEYHDGLASVAEFLAENPEVTATMEGHADNTSPDSADTISRQRARRVADYLVDHFDIDPSRLSVQGFGATRRFNYNLTTEGRQENRRVNIILDYPG